MSDLRTVHDQMGREVTFSFPPKRIISLVPSQTEFLIDIGAPVFGRTKFCIHPYEKVNQIPVIGGTKNFRFEKIEELKPDLIIGNKEENYEEGILRLEEKHPVWMSDIANLSESFDMMKSLGQITDREKPAETVLTACREAIDKVQGTKSGKVIYLIWKNPWMVAGKETFLDHMLHFLGYENLIKADRYPELTLDEMKELQPDQLFLSSEPFPFQEKHLDELQELFPETDCQLVDGELFSWYGSRLSKWT